MVQSHGGNRKRASTMNLTSVLSMEDDVVPSAFTKSRGAFLFAASLSHRLRRIPWQGLKLSATYGKQTRKSGKCQKGCECEVAAEWHDAGNLILCRIVKVAYLMTPTFAFFTNQYSQCFWKTSKQHVRSKRRLCGILPVQHEKSQV
jgi:hypothetical protein